MTGFFYPFHLSEDMNKKFRALLTDIDGTIYFKGKMIDGALECLRELKRKGVRIRYLTNTASKPVDNMLEKLRAFGIDAVPEEIFNPIRVAKAYFQKHAPETYYVMASADIQAEFQGPQWDDKIPTYVLLGDIQDVCSYHEINRVFQFIRNGSQLISTSYSPFYYHADGKVCVDTGAFARLFEFSLNIKAELVAKPSHLFFQMAQESTGLDKSECVVVGDDIDSDILGANTYGLFSALVRTGKYDADRVASSTVVPGEIIDSLAEAVHLFQ